MRSGPADSAEAAVGRAAMDWARVSLGFLPGRRDSILACSTEDADKVVDLKLIN